MAITSEVGGFEGGDPTGCTVLGGGVTAAAVRTGTYGFRASPAASNNYGVQVGQGLAGFASQTPHAAFGQFCFRWNGAPSVDNSMLCGFQDWMWITCNVNGTGTLRVAGIGTTAISLPAYSNTTIFFRVQLRQWAPGDGTTTKTYLAIIDHYTAAGVLDFYASATLTAVNIGFTAVTPLTLGSIAAQALGSPTWQLDFDDYIYMAASGLADTTDANNPIFQNGSAAFLSYGTSPLKYDTVYPVLIASQGPQDGFAPAGRFDLINEIPKGAGQISSASGWTNYNDVPLSAIFNEVQAYTFRVNATASPQKSHFLTVNATTIAVTIGASSADSNASSLLTSKFYPLLLGGALLTTTTFNATQFGVQNNDATSTITIQNMYIEALSGDPNGVPQKSLTLDAGAFVASPNFDLTGSGLAHNSDVTLATSVGFTAAEGVGVAMVNPSIWKLQRMDIRIEDQDDPGGG